MDEPERFLTAAELATMLQCSRAYVYRLANTGAVPTYRIGTHHRFLASEVREALRAEQEKPIDIWERPARSHYGGRRAHTW
ncbi:helix-turn-helix domain-containing protein [Microbacterium gorillae]|uniref:helix-turn-helix domain-containing protein n=1 Tax=Microbacterium gorillae TaxID=1231063 RepID=UPI00058DCBF8|nr:helix-turn-helix domain-containing protein [Microbacterium gorillae]